MLEPISGILGAFTGFAASALTSYLEIRKQREQNTHELAMAQTVSDLKLREYEVMADDQEHARLIDHDSKIEGLRALVRPILTFSLVGISLLLGVCGVIGWIPGFDSVAWSNWLFAASSTVLAFWFGSRQFSKSNRTQFVRRSYHHDEEN